MNEKSTSRGLELTIRARRTERTAISTHIDLLLKVVSVLFVPVRIQLKIVLYVYIIPSNKFVDQESWPQNFI